MILGSTAQSLQDFIRSKLRNNRDFWEFRWDVLVRNVLRIIYKCPKIDLMITPTNLLANGCIIAPEAPLQPEIDCPILQTPFARNVFRLYATLLLVCVNITLGNPYDHVSKLRAAENTHKLIIDTLVDLKNQFLREGLDNLHLILFSGNLVHIK